MAGRKPTVSPGKQLNRSNVELNTREEQTPIYQRQDFRPPRSLTKEERKVWKWLAGIFRETVNFLQGSRSVGVSKVRKTLPSSGRDLGGTSDRTQSGATVHHCLYPRHKGLERKRTAVREKLTTWTI